MGLDDRVLKYQTIKLSDHADPDALKAEGETAGKAPGGEETTVQNETPAVEEGKNGLQ